MQQQCRLLVVDDEPLIQDLLQTALTEAGFRVVTAGDGDRAVAELDAAATGFAAVITEVRLYAGPDGWAVGRHARAVAPGIPVIYISGDSLHEWPGKAVPGSARVPKPFVPASLVRALAPLLNKAGMLPADS